MNVFSFLVFTFDELMSDFSLKLLYPQLVKVMPHRPWIYCSGKKKKKVKHIKLTDLVCKTLISLMYANHSKAKPTAKEKKKPWNKSKRD